MISSAVVTLPALAADSVVMGGLDEASLIVLGVLGALTIAMALLMSTSGLSIRYALTNLLRRRMRGVFALIGIAVAISVVVAILQATRGIERGVTAMLTEFRGDIIVQQQSQPSLPLSQVPERELRAALAAIDGVEHVEPYCIRLVGVSFPFAVDPEIATIFARLDVDVPEVPAQIIAWDTDARILDKCIEEGGTEPVRFSAPNAYELVLGKQVADMFRATIANLLESDRYPDAIKAKVRESLGPLGLPMVTFNGHVFTIKAVFETRSYQDTQAIIPLRTYQEVFEQPDRVSAVVVYADSSSKVDAIAAAARGLSVDGKRFKVRKTDEFLNQFDEFNKLRTMILAIGFLSAIAGAVSIGNTMMSNVHERTREIGLLRSVGWSQGMVLSAVLIEGVVLSVLGGAGGIVLGVIELELAERVIGYDPTPLGYEPFVMLLGMCLAIALGIVGSAIPGLRACQLSPVEAMRYE